MCMYVCTYTFMLTSACMPMHPHVCTHMHVHIYIDPHIHARTHMQKHSFLLKCSGDNGKLFTGTQANAHTHMHIYVQTHNLF